MSSNQMSRNYHSRIGHRSMSFSGCCRSNYKFGMCKFQRPIRVFVLFSDYNLELAENGSRFSLNKRYVN